MIKDILYTGIGAVSVLKEKVEEEVKKLEESGKLKTADAKSFLDSVAKRGEEEEKKNKEKMKEFFKEIIKELDIATKQDIQKLEEKLK